MKAKNILRTCIINLDTNINTYIEMVVPQFSEATGRVVLIWVIENLELLLFLVFLLFLQVHGNTKTTNI